MSDSSDARDARGRDALGFVAERCVYCDASLYLSDDSAAEPICLNACHLPHGVVRRMNVELARIAVQQRVQTRPPTDE